MTASFAGSADYLPATNSTTFTVVGKATPPVSVSDNGGTYDDAHGLPSPPPPSTAAAPLWKPSA